MVDFFVCEKIILKDVIKIIKQEIQFEESLKQRIEFTRGFSKTFIKGSIRKIEKTNLSYIEPHKVIALAQTYFAVQTRKQEITKKEYNLLTED